MKLLHLNYIILEKYYIIKIYIIKAILFFFQWRKKHFSTSLTIIILNVK